MNRPDPDIDVRHLLNAQTGRITWTELQRPFAQGLLLQVAAGMDLVETAARVVENDSQTVQDWLERGKLRRIDTRQAKAWLGADQEFWAVVAAPWVLIQELEDTEDMPAGR